jgi:hypothetical protein
MTPRLVVLLAMLATSSTQVSALRLHGIGPRLRVGAATCHRTLGSVRACIDDEVERAQRRRDNDALRSELEAPTSNLVDEDSMATLRDYIEVIEDKDTKMAEIKDMLRSMQAGVGIRFLGDEDEILTTAWVFVGLNILVAIYAMNGLLLEPMRRSLAG